jgi:hypothetical protein
MSPIEKVVATAEVYQRIHDLLIVEEMVLSLMGPQEPEHRGHVIAQMSRVEALRQAEQRLASDAVAAGTQP